MTVSTICRSVLGATLLFGGGCAGYRLGPTNGLAAGGKSVQINLFQNETMEPRLIEAVATALRRGIQRDGTYRLETGGAPDIILNGTLTRYERSGLSYDPRDVLTVRDFDISVVAKITAVERVTGQVVLDREVAARTTVRSGADLPSAERQAVPLLAEDLARNVTGLLVDGTW